MNCWGMKEESFEKVELENGMFAIRDTFTGKWIMASLVKSEPVFENTMLLALANVLKSDELEEIT